MPGKIKVKILAGRNLPVMDRSGDTTDAYVEIKFGNTTYKTDVCRKSLNPQWNSEWYRFEVDDAELQDEPLQVRLMDHDTYSANDAIGKVYVNLNPLLLPGSPLAVKNIWTLEATMNSSSGSQGGSVMTGWIPVFDTMHGIRGEVNIIVKVELFSDCNKFRQSSCGVQFFYSPNIPHGYHAQVIHGFVEELVVSDDPEYKWIDKIRTPRASNEARQTLFLKMSGEVQRKIGLKALDLGGNAVIGYVQNFDLEGESGIVARGIGTAVTLVKLQDITSSLPIETSNIEDLTCFGLQSKTPLDFYESDDSLPLLANSPNQSPAAPCSPINIHPTTISKRFPKYEKSPKHQRRATARVAEYRASAMRARQFSLQSNAMANNAPIRKGIGSSLSLAEDLISETSLKNMLALEDMRGEPAGNPFSRGLKNFRYLHQNILPKRVAQIKSRFADSLDDESDPDSNYSSTWSLAGSESNRSSIVDLRQSIRRKKFTHKKMPPNDGIAALLIRSVHAGFPLDSVKEDRETPAPSPVNFLGDTTEYVGDRSITDNDDDTTNANVEASKSQEDSAILEKTIVPASEKLDPTYASDRSIPMISSSESDTSSSDDDEPSESSTNYNILDETCSLIEPNSPDERKYYRSFSKVSKSSEISSRSVTSPIKIIKQSFESKDIAEIVPVREENPDLKTRRDRSLESSTDYNILDETSSLPESKFPDDPLNQSDLQPIIDVDRTATVGTLTSSEMPEKVNKSTTKADLATDDETKFTDTSLPACLSKYSINYNFLDDTQSLIDPGIPDNETFPITFHRDVVDETVPQVTALTELVSSPYLEEGQQSLEFDNTSNVDLYSPDDSPFCEKFTALYAQNTGAESVTEIVDKGPSILSASLTDIDEPVGAIAILTEKLPRERAPSLPNDKLDSSTDYNILDDSCSLTERSSFGDDNLKSDFPKILDTANLAASLNIGELILPLCLSQIDVASGRLEDAERAASKQDFDFDSQADRNLDSSTDYNVLEETTSLNEASSLDETKLGSVSQSVETAGCPKMISDLTLPPVLELIDSLPRIPVDVESPRRGNFVAPFSTTSVIDCGNDEDDPDLSASTSSSSSRMPQSPVRLKFLPKQKHFDSAEDLDFATSTPVETDVTPPDFSTIEKSPESPEYKKWDFPSIPASPNSRLDFFDTHAVRNEDRTSLDPSTPRTFMLVEKIFDNKGKPICPLGVPVDRVTTASDIRAVNSTKTVRDSKIIEASRENEYSSRVSGPSVRNEETPPPVKKTTAKKAQKKVERTDTVIYKGPIKDREKTTMRSETNSREAIVKTGKKAGTASSSIPIIVAPPPEEHTTRLQVPVIQTTSINVHSTHSPDEMKTQYFGSVATRKCQPDEFTLSEKFNRKYRQHCILDLIKTIDTKMMTHHSHHERRDSTRSRQRRKRERMNASATPSPDSIHRTKSHRRRSRSRSPDRQHVHSKVSPLSIHSFPVKAASSSNLTCEPLPLDSSCENISKKVIANSHTLVSKDPPNDVLVNDTSSSRNGDPSSINAESTNSKITMNNPPDVPLTSNNPANFDDNTIVPVTNKISANCLLPKDTEHPVFKSHSAGSLDKFGQCSSSSVTKITNNPNTTDDLCVPCLQLTHRQQDEQPSSPLPASTVLPSSLGSKATPNPISTKNNTAVPNMHRRSSDSDLSITPKGNSLAGSDRSMGGHLRPSTAIVRTMNQDTMEMLEYPFITMQQYPAGFLLNIGGLVSARSVKLLERITNLEEPEGRDAWWTEIRMEVRSHARALACNVVLGYKEEISICDDVCVLNASGTAAVINLLNASQDQDNVVLSRGIMTTSLESEREKTQAKSSLVKPDKIEETVQQGQQQSQQQQISGKLKRTSESNDHEVPYMPTVSACSLCHLPYSEASVPFRVDVSKCSICKRAKVPDVLFTTIELPENIPMTGRGVFLQATVCKCKRDLRGELNAKEISDCLPFLEYELHSLLLNKLKVKGMNAIFGLKVQVSVGERLVIGMAVGTAVYLTALPTPSVPQIASGNSWHNEEQLAEIQKNLIETVRKNREFYRLKPIVDIENGRAMATSDTDESDDDLPDLDLGIGTKDACVLEVDDVEDMDRINLLMDEKPPDDFHVVNTQSIPGLEDLEIVRNLQMFTQISRAKIPAGQFASMPSKYFARMLQTVLFKLRRMVPCALCDMQFKVALPEQDEIQLSVVGMALGLGEPTRFSKYKRKIIPNSTSKDPIKKTDEADLIFSLDEDQVDVVVGPPETAMNPSNTSISNSSPLTGVANQKHRPRSPFRTKSVMQHRHKHVPLKERYGVDITPLSYLPGGKIERYLGNLNFFFIRESTSIRENGGLSGFTHSFVTEVLAIVRAHITALGGNAMVAFFMTQCVLLHSPHKNQGQCLINVGGDVVTVSYYGDEKYQGNQNC